MPQRPAHEIAYGNYSLRLLTSEALEREMHYK